MRYTDWGYETLSRSIGRNRGRNRLPKLVQTIALSIPFPGRRFISPVCRGIEKWSHSTFYWLVHVEVLEQMTHTKRSPVYCHEIMIWTAVWTAWPTCRLHLVIHERVEVRIGAPTCCFGVPLPSPFPMRYVTGYVVQWVHGFITQWGAEPATNPLALVSDLSIRKVVFCVLSRDDWIN